jgi:hypothetical protein
MHFRMKSTLKSNRNDTSKHANKEKKKQTQVNLLNLG